MVSEVHSKISNPNAISMGGNLAVKGNSGGGSASVILRHQTSSVSSVKFLGSFGLLGLV